MTESIPKYMKGKYLSLNANNSTNEKFSNYFKFARIWTWMSNNGARIIRTKNMRKSLCELSRMCKLSMRRSQWGSIELCKLSKMCESAMSNYPDYTVKFGTLYVELLILVMTLNKFNLTRNVTVSFLLSGVLLRSKGCTLMYGAHRESYEGFKGWPLMYGASLHLPSSVRRT